jgi:hypothetical protein
MGHCHGVLEKDMVIWIRTTRANIYGFLKEDKNWEVEAAASVVGHPLILFASNCQCNGCLLQI